MSETEVERRKTQFWGYDQHERSMLDVVDEDEWQSQLEWALNESLAYARLVECPENVTQARHCTSRDFMGHFEAMLNDLLHEPLNICTATETTQETEQSTLITDGGTSDAEIQQTLTGERTELERKTCGVYADEACSRDAEYDFGDVIACTRCAKEITEPKHPDDAENAQQLRATEKIITEGSA